MKQGLKIDCEKPGCMSRILVYGLRSANRNWLCAACAADCLDNLRREAEANVFRHNLNFFDAVKTVQLQIIDNIFDEDFGGRGAGRHCNCIYALQPCGIDGLLVLDQIADGSQVA